MFHLFICLYIVRERDDNFGFSRIIDPAAVCTDRPATNDVYFQTAASRDSPPPRFANLKGRTAAPRGIFTRPR